jgi:hypothetical protein
MSRSSANRHDRIITDQQRMEVVPLNTNQPIGGIGNNEIPSITALVNSLRQDINNIKNQL